MTQFLKNETFNKRRRLGRSLRFIQSISFCSLFFAFSMVLLNFYVNGDQINYRAFYDQVSDVGFFEAYVLARGIVGASEPVSLFLLWLGSSLAIDKNIYISSWNVFFLFLLWKLCKRYDVKLFVFFLIVFNFYTLVLLTGAERLKFGYFFVVLIPFLSKGLRPLGFLIAGLAHFQMFLIFPSIVIASYYKEILRAIKYGFVNKYILRMGFFSFFIFLVIFVGFADAFFNKFYAYFSQTEGVASLINVMLLTVAALLATTNWKRMLLSIMPFYALITLLGGERVNMLAVTVVLWILMTENRTGHPVSLLLLGYFLVKSFGFIYRVVLFGDAFPH